MSDNSWPEFHFDPVHFPASHPGHVDTCSICRAGQMTIDDQEAS